MTDFFLKQMQCMEIDEDFLISVDNGEVDIFINIGIPEHLVYLIYDKLNDENNINLLYESKSIQSFVLTLFESELEIQEQIREALITEFEQSEVQKQLLKSGLAVLPERANRFRQPLSENTENENNEYENTENENENEYEYNETDEINDEINDLIESTEEESYLNLVLPYVNGKLSTCASEFWFPSSSTCVCCTGFKHGCICNGTCVYCITDVKE